ncbi:ArnT family glycosyltransferase [Croceivirga lutea]|uniref:ArnT family glycosyltransferase n=1 Tax=Croceivirga lutea TaxID=1775167 RepID=UPI001639E0C2|nr:glycosyltransferase family 39 protein [Croceivirga lutea]
MQKYFPRLFLLLLGLLFLINLLQSNFTQLIYDEAYYWYYAQHMAWGYFDHPPMIAGMIKLSSWIATGELGVRLVTTVFSVGTLALLWLQIDHKDKNKNIPLFFLLVFAMPLLNAYGFFTLPDTPLLFFSALFLLIYKRFLVEPSWTKALVMGIVMAAMMYSKYHAALIIIFVLLSNISLLKNKYAWAAVSVALLSFVPHFIWLNKNDWVTIFFHIYERPNQAYTFTGNTLGYLVNLIANFGLLFPFVYWALYKTKITDKYTKALVYLSVGFILFFFISTFNRRSQAQWVIALCIPLTVLTYNWLLQNTKARIWTFRLGIASLLLLLYARVWLIYQPLLPKVFETHGNKAFTERILEKADGAAVIFENSYRRASMFSFYAGQPSFSLNNLFYRYNQYALDDSENYFQAKRVAYISPHYPAKDFKVMYKDSSSFNGTFIDNFTSYRKLKVIIPEDEVLLDVNPIEIKIYNPYKVDIPVDSLKFYGGFTDGYKKMQKSYPLELNKEYSQLLLKQDTTTVHVNIPSLPENDFEYIRFGILENNLFPGINSKPYKLVSGGGNN